MYCKFLERHPQTEESDKAFEKTQLQKQVLKKKIHVTYIGKLPKPLPLNM